MERRIYEAAVEGSVISLRNLLQEDALVLDRIMGGCYAKTPLHIASMLGHAEFLQEILSRKPELVGELDSRKSSPLHLAAAKGYLDVVKKLVSINPEMCFGRDRDGRNPLQVAAIKGHINVLQELVQVKPQAVRISMDRGETILHVCVRYNQFEAMKFLVETMSDNEFVNCKDDDGNTILHLAVDDKKVEAIKFLSASTTIEVNALNANGLTAMDILTQSTNKDVKDWEIGELLRRAGGISAKDGIQLPPSSTQPRILTSHEGNQITTAHPKGKDSKSSLKSRDDRLENMYNALMVVASVLAIVAIQAGLNPPAGVWQDNYQDVNDTINFLRAGRPVMQDVSEYRYTRFLAYNTTSLVASLSIILSILLTTGIRCLRGSFFMWVLMVVMWIAINAMVMAYLTSVYFLTTEGTQIPVIYINLVWFCLAAVLALMLLIRLIVIIVKAIKNLVRKLKQRSRKDDREPQHTV